MILFKKNK